VAERRDYAAIALKYARDVVGGSIAACKWTVAACLRQLDDLERQDTEAFPYRYDPARGARVCKTIELLPHIKGRWKTKTITLEPWQIFGLMVVFSWVWSTAAHAEEDMRAKDGLRRYRTSYKEVPRKNAKSTESAGVGLYMTGPDGEQGAENYSTATTRDQAKIVWSVAKAMAKKTPEYLQRFGVQVLAHTLIAPDTESEFKALSAEDDTMDGLNPHFACVDELHAHKTRGVWDVLETATGAREQSLLWTITTAGSNRAGICYEVRTYVTKILNAVLARHPELCEARGYKLEGGSVDDETFFGIIYTIDDGDDWTDPAIWAKANPNLGVSVKLDDIARLCRKAQQTPSAQPNFLTKRLNVWINADSAWMDMRRWDQCADPTLSIDDFAGEDCFVAVDLASSIDIAAKLYLFRRVLPTPTKSGALEEKAHFYAFGRFYVPEDVIEESDNSQYAGWEQTGRLITTDGSIIDQNVIQDDLREAKSRFRIRELVYDPFQATKFATELQTEGFTVVQYGATVKNFSAPMKEVEALVLDARLHHDGDPVLGWMISNVVAHVDRKDNVFPNKQTANNKIDGPVALIMAMGRAMHAPAPEGPPRITVIEDTAADSSAETDPELEEHEPW
jgi:phage terminase large subunit-like protein